MDKSIYVASPSAEPYISRTEEALKKLIAGGWTPTLDWTKSVRQQGSGSPHNPQIRVECAIADLDAVERCAVLWLRLPDTDAHRLPPFITSSGAFVELGYKLALKKFGIDAAKGGIVIVSGDNDRCIFADPHKERLVDYRFRSHDDALAFILQGQFT